MIKIWMKYSIKLKVLEDSWNVENEMILASLIEKVGGGGG